MITLLIVAAVFWKPAVYIIRQFTTSKPEKKEEFKTKLRDWGRNFKDLVLPPY